MTTRSLMTAGKQGAGENLAVGSAAEVEITAPFTDCLLTGCPN